MADAMDPSSEKLLGAVHPVLADKIRTMASTLAAQGIIIHVIQGLRTKEQQDALFAKGRTIAPIGTAHVVTNAPGGYSNHNFGMAVDLAPGLPGTAQWTPDWHAADARYIAMVKVGESLGLVSGSEWHSIVDWPHFQLPGVPVTPTDGMRTTLASAGLNGLWAEFAPLAPDPNAPVSV